MEISVVITLINIILCYIYNFVNTKESFSNFITNKKNNLIISSSVVLILSIFYFDLK